MKQTEDVCLFDEVDKPPAPSGAAFIAYKEHIGTLIRQLDDYDRQSVLQTYEKLRVELAQMRRLAEMLEVYVE